MCDILKAKRSAEKAYGLLSIPGTLNPTSWVKFTFVFESIATKPTNRIVMIVLPKPIFKGKSNYNEMRVI